MWEIWMIFLLFDGNLATKTIFLIIVDIYRERPINAIE